MNSHEIELSFQQECKTIGLQINEAHFSLFRKYFDYLIEINQHMNLTGITDEMGVYFKHYFDSIYPASKINLGTNVRVLDIGPGAGFPSIPLKILYPGTEFVLIETLNKRVNFLRNLSSLLQLDHIQCVHGRAEELAHSVLHRSSFDFVIVRAVSNLSTLVEVCLPYLKRTGRLICLKGPDVTDEINAASNALKLLNGKIVRVHQYQLPFDLGGRSLIEVSVKDLSHKSYPRKQGLPFNKPL